MNEKQIVGLFHGNGLDRKSLEAKLAVVTAQEEQELTELLTHLTDNGILAESNGTYFVLSEADEVLGQVTLKKRNFVIVRPIPSGEEIRLSGEEADGLLVGDQIYLKPIRGVYHAVEYKKPVTSFKGRYSVTENGAKQLLVDYLNEAGKRILVGSVKEGLNPNQGDLVLAAIQSYDGKNYTVRVEEILVSAQDVGSDISMILSEADVPMAFPQDVLDEVKSIPSSLSEDDMKDRVDYRNDVIVTIDGKDSHDFDDAVTAKRDGTGYEIGVHIADVTHYVKPNHPLDREAENRGTSVYVADRVVPMLPVELSNGICSLNPNEDRLVLSVILNVDPSGRVFHKEIHRGVMRSHARLTYDEVNDFFAGKETSLSPEVKDVLTLLHEASLAVRKRRDRQGAMKLDSTELKFTLDENGEPTDVRKEESGPSEKMIEDLMILANVAVAQMLKEKNIPVLYRVHEFPPMKKYVDFKDFLRHTEPKLLSSFPKRNDLSGARLNDFLASVEDPSVRSVLSYMMLRMMAKARYSPEELGHFGLAEPYYCHFTSPIRRYPDDLIHRLVKEYLLDGRRCDYDSVYNYLLSEGDKTSASEVRSDQVERSVDDLESAKYLRHHIGEVYHGKVTGLVGRGMFVETSLGIEGFLPYSCMHGDFFAYDEKTYSAVGKYHPEFSFSIGTPVDVAVLSSDPISQEIDFATPEFYDRFAKNATESEREKLASGAPRAARPRPSRDFEMKTKARPFSDKGPLAKTEEKKEETAKNTAVEEKAAETIAPAVVTEEKIAVPEEAAAEKEVAQREENAEAKAPAEEKPLTHVSYGKSGYGAKHRARSASSEDRRPDGKRGFSKRPMRPVDPRGFDSQTAPFDAGRKEERRNPEHKGYSGKPSRQGFGHFHHSDTKGSYPHKDGTFRSSSYGSKGSYGSRGSYGSKGSYRPKDSDGSKRPYGKDSERRYSSHGSYGSRKPYGTSGGRGYDRSSGSSRPEGHGYRRNDSDRFHSGRRPSSGFRNGNRGKGYNKNGRGGFRGGNHGNHGSSGSGSGK